MGQCGARESDEPDASLTRQGQVGEQFAGYLITGAFSDAYQMLSQSLQDDLSLDDMRQTYQEMISYADSPPYEVGAITSMDDWPDKLEDDIGWVYVGIAMDGASEAVSVVVDGDKRIREIEWGRP